MAWEDQVKTELTKIIEAIENGSKHVAEEIAEFLGIEKEDPAAEPAPVEAPVAQNPDPSPPVKNV
jgi:hypothetical protein